MVDMRRLCLPSPSMSSETFLTAPGSVVVTTGRDGPNCFSAVIDNSRLGINPYRWWYIPVGRGIVTSIGRPARSPVTLGKRTADDRCTQADGDPLPAMPLHRSRPCVLSTHERYQDHHQEKYPCTFIHRFHLLDRLLLHEMH
jgi:hypothetical protein